MIVEGYDSDCINLDYYYSIPYHSIYEISFVFRSFGKSKKQKWRCGDAIFFNF